MVVAPRVGAWIETPFLDRLITPFVSRPAWARGLKQLTKSNVNAGYGRAPRGRVD